MNKSKSKYPILIGLFIILCALGLVGFGASELRSALSKNQSDNLIGSNVSDSQELMAEPSPDLGFLTAKFLIVTNSLIRDFDNPMYQDLSDSAFIPTGETNTLKFKAGVTWSEFFGSLPFSIDRDCLITGTKQKFCNSQASQLRFFLNGQPTSAALDLQIENEDELLIIYGPKSQDPSVFINKLSQL